MRAAQNQPSWGEWFEWLADRARQAKHEAQPAHMRHRDWKPQPVRETTRKGDTMSIALRILVGVVAALFAMLGARWMLAPTTIAAEQAMTLASPVALNTARGDIGGLFVGGALLCVLGLVRKQGHWLQAAAVLVGCVAVGRVLGMALDGFAPESGSAFAVELVIVAVLLLAARSGPKTA